MKKPIHFRQGDVLLVSTDDIPTSAIKMSHKIVAEGEATGHHHQFLDDGVMLYEEKGDLYIEVFLDSSTLTHEEHHAIVVPKGIYKVVKQREYDPLNDIIRRVID